MKAIVRRIYVEEGKRYAEIEVLWDQPRALPFEYLRIYRLLLKTDNKVIPCEACFIIGLREGKLAYWFLVYDPPASLRKGMELHIIRSERVMKNA